MVERVRKALLAALFVPSACLACDCGPAGPACAYVSRAATVFVGRVAFTDHDPSLGLRQRTFVKFVVEEAFKGLLPETQEVWVDPGSFTSCYAEYSVGERLMVFAYGGQAMPPDTSMMSVIPGQLKQKPLPVAIDRTNPPVVYSAPECSGTRGIIASDRGLMADLEYLRRYKAGSATPLVRGRIVEDSTFGIFEPPGLNGVLVTLSASGFNRSARTDADGYYLFDDVPVGSYVVTPSLKPYVARWEARDIEVPHSGCGSADFDMTAPGIIQGTLMDSSSRPAANVRVEVLRLDKQGKPIFYAEKQVQTDVSGKFRFEELPSGNFQVGVNLFEAPDPMTPYGATKWSENGRSSIHLTPGEYRRITPFRLPPPSVVRKIDAEVRWPDGRPAQGVTVWGDVGDRAAASGETDANGLTRIDLLQGISYSIEAKIWVGSGGQREVARSGVTELTPGSDSIRLKLVLSKRTKEYR